MPFSANSRNAVGTSNFGTSNLGISNLGISNFGVSKAGALTATGFDFVFGVAAALEVVSAMTVILDLGGRCSRQGRHPRQSARAVALPPGASIFCRAVD